MLYIIELLKSILNFLQGIAVHSTQIVKNGIHYGRNVWRSQLKASRSPWSSCFSHSMAWFLQNVGIQVTPDEITAALNDDPIFLNWAKLKYGSSTVARFAGKMQMLWELQEYYANRMMSGINNRAQFNCNTSAADIEEYLDNGPVIVNTSPTYQGRVLGHVVLIVGKDDDNFIVDDPFGSFVDNYISHDNGDDVRVSKTDFSKIRGSLSIHFISKVGA